jgi:predicted small integral membrane protein
LVEPGETLLWIKTLLVGGLAGYLTLIVLNNVTDPLTNSAAVGRMMTMRELKEDPLLGRGVVWRAIDSGLVHRAAYRLVIVVQVAAAGLLWRALVMLVHAGLDGWAAADARPGIAAANLGLLVLVALALAFILTGLWFSYWVKMAPVQQAHTTLLFLSLLSVIIVNLDS